jgi:anti-anti-sigma factor
MSPPTVHPPPKVEQAGNVRVLTFTADAARDLENMLARELEGRTGGLGGGHLLLDFGNVAYVNSLELGTLVGLHNRMRAAGGRLTLFNLSDQVYEVFTTTRLQALLGICREGNMGPQDGSTTVLLGKRGDGASRVGDCGPGDPDKYVYCG